MKASIACIFIIIASSCAQQKESATESVTDSTQTQVEILSEPIHASEDSSIYIGTMSAFQETKEFFTSVYYLESIQDDNPFEFLSTKVDSLIYEDNSNGTRRSRLPMNIASQYFNLSGLDRVSVYNESGELVTDATLVRIELYEDVIESEFIAVFKPEVTSWLTSEVSYCISGSPGSYKIISVVYKELDDKNLTDKLSKRFETDSSKVREVQHIQFLRDKSICSAISLDKGIYLIETTGSESVIVYQSKEENLIMGVVPVQVDFNGKPVLLVTMGLNDTDMIWTSLMAYSSSGYEIMPSNRVKVNLMREN